MSEASLARALPADDRILLDSSALIAYLDGREPVSRVAVHVIDVYVRSGRNEALVSTVSMMELLVRPLRRGAQEPYRHVVEFLTLFPHLRLIGVDPVVAQEAASLRAAHNLSTPDALIIGTGMVAQVGHLVTNDARWRPALRPLARRISVCELSRHLPFP